MITVRALTQFDVRRATQKYADLERVFELAAQDAIPEIKALYEATWATWEEQPGIEPHLTERQLTFELTGEKAQHWFWIDQGTRPRDILPLPGNVNQTLDFRENFTAKTQRGVIGSGSGGKSGRYIHLPQVGGGVTAQQSIEARKWTPAIREKAREIMLKKIQARVKALAR